MLPSGKNIYNSGLACALLCMATNFLSVSWIIELTSTLQNISELYICVYKAIYIYARARRPLLENHEFRQLYHQDHFHWSCHPFHTYNWQHTSRVPNCILHGVTAWSFFEQFKVHIHLEAEVSWASTHFQLSSLSSWNALYMKSLKRLEYCLGSTADIEVGSYWKDLYACSSFLLIS